MRIIHMGTTSRLNFDKYEDVEVCYLRCACWMWGNNHV